MDIVLSHSRRRDDEFIAYTVLKLLHGIPVPGDIIRAVLIGLVVQDMSVPRNGKTAKAERFMTNDEILVESEQLLRLIRHVSRSTKNMCPAPWFGRP